MIKQCSLAVLCILLLTLSVQAQIPLKNAAGASIEDLIAEGALVTIVLKRTSARDANVKITGMHKTTLTFTADNGQPNAYPISMIKEIRVQENLVRVKKKSHIKGGALTNEDKQLMNRAARRAEAIFKSSQGNQEVKMLAASILAISGEHDAVLYLRGLAEGNDIPTAIQASVYLYSIGEEVREEVLQEGFISGNRQTRASAAYLTGLVNAKQFQNEVRTILKDPAVDMYPAAAKAVAWMDDTQAIPDLIKGLHALKLVKAETAVFALTELNSPEVMPELQSMLKTSRGNEWFRILRILYAMGDESAAELMITKGLTTTNFAPIAAIILSEDSNWDGIMWLRNYMDSPSNPTINNLLYKANAAAALFQSGHIQAKSDLQRLLNYNPNQVYAKGRTDDEQLKKLTVIQLQIEVCSLIGAMGDRTLFSLLPAQLENTSPLVSLAAAQAAFSIANEDYRERLEKLNIDRNTKLVILINNYL